MSAKSYSKSYKFANVSNTNNNLENLKKIVAKLAVKIVSVFLVLRFRVVLFQKYKKLLGFSFNSV